MFDKCLDISHNNGKILWSKVAGAGYRLVFVKATQGTKFVDPEYDTNEEKATDNEIMVVPYHFINAEPADLQAANFIEATELAKGDAYMLDWERLNNTMPPIRLVEALGDNLRQQTGRDPLVYHGLYELSSKKINAWPWFVPKWGKEPKMKWLFWQDTDSMLVPGITGHVDRDKFMGGEDELVDWYNTGALPVGMRL